MRAPDRTLNEAFGERLRELRTMASVSQDLLSTRSGLSRASIVNVEKGRQGVSLSSMYRLADALGIDPTELLPKLAAPTSVRMAIGDSTAGSLRSVEKVIRRIERDGET